MNISDLVGRYTPGYSNAFGQNYDGFSADLGVYAGGSTAPQNLVQRFRETAMRALVDVGTAGTWNLMIDIVAQSGRYPANATGLANFLVKGERGYWVHVSIDRTTKSLIKASKL